MRTKSLEDVITNGVTAEDVQEALHKARVIFLGIHDCSMCGYPCGYVIEGDHVTYDSGCDCGVPSDLNPSSFDDIANHINMQRGEFEGVHWRERLWRACNGEGQPHVRLCTHDHKAEDPTP